MKKFFAFIAVLSTTCLIPLKAAENIAQGRAGNPVIKTDKTILEKINRMAMPFSGKAVNKSGYSVQTPHFWEIKVQKDVYHAAVIFEDYPDGIHPDSQRFISLFMVWKNGKIHYRRVIENDPKRIKITSCKMKPSSDGEIYLVLDYDFSPYYEDSFTDTDGKCRISVPVTGHLHASIADFDNLPIGKLTIKNGEARAKILPQPSPDIDYSYETDNYRRKNPVYQLVFPHGYMVKNGNHTFHIALVDRQHEDLLAVYIWKDRKQHSVYLLDHYEQFYSTPDRMKINSGAGATRIGESSDGKFISIPVWDSIFLRYTINNHLSKPDREYAPSTSYYKHNYLTIDLKNPGTYDMRKQQFNQGFIYSPQLK